MNINQLGWFVQLMERERIKPTAITIKGKTSVQISFTVSNRRLTKILQVAEEVGCIARTTFDPFLPAHHSRVQFVLPRRRHA